MLSSAFISFFIDLLPTVARLSNASFSIIPKNARGESKPISQAA
jgi:hypothetical protein